MSFNISLSGVNSTMGVLGNLSNNIANKQSAGFKTSRVDLAESMGAGGVTTSGISKNFTQGNLKSTGNPLDLALAGNGFFTVSDNGEQQFTRAGGFHLSQDGFIVNSKNQRLQGFLTDTQGNVSGQLGDLQINSQGLQPQASSNINLEFNLDAQNDPPAAAFTPGFTALSPPSSNSYNYKSDSNFYDSLGTQHTLSTYYVKTGTPNTYDVYTAIDGQDVTAPPPPQISFSETGKISGASDITISNYTPSNGAATQSITVSLANSTQFSGENSVYRNQSNGFGTANLSQISVDKTGIIQAQYSNGQSQTVGQIAVANFTAPQELNALGNSSYGETFGSGAALINAPGSNGTGLINSGYLEESNTQIETDLVGLLQAQRDFEANVQVIKTFDAITQTLTNLKN